MLQACLLAGIYLAVNLRLPELGRAHFGNPAPFYQPHAGFPPCSIGQPTGSPFWSRHWAFTTA